MALHAICNIEVDHQPQVEVPLSGSAADKNAVRNQLHRMLSNPLFANCERQSELLNYIVKQSLEPHHESLKERLIGIEVFKRTTDFDTSIDSIVRVTATELRKRLARYYEDPAHKTELLIELPTRSYVATFKQAPQPPEGAGPEVKPEPGQIAETVSSTAYRKQIYISASIAILILLILGGFLLRPPSPSTAMDIFWSPLVHSSGPVLISIASPPPAQSKQTHSIPRPSPNTAEQTDVSLGAFISHQANYPISEIAAANSVNAYLASQKKQATISLAQSTSLDELRQAPVVFLGSYLNPWAMRLGSGLRFQFQHDEGGMVHWIEDTRNPGTRAWTVNMLNSYRQVTDEYALITRAMDPTTGQWWIGIGGTTVLGTVGAERMLLDSNKMAGLSSQLPKGWEKQNLQIVVRFKVVDGSLGASQVLDTYSW